MGNGYVIPPKDEIDELVQWIRDLSRRIDELERPSGTQTAQAVKTLRQLVDGILEQTEVNVSGNVTSGGDVTAADWVIAGAGVRSPATYSNILTTSYRSLWVSSTEGPGNFGHVPSSRRFKTEIQTAPDQSALALAMRVVTFRYKAAVESLGDEAAVEWGLIAEELHDLGLTWLVDYDEDGEPFSVRHERLILAFIPVIQDHETRLRAIENGGNR